MDIRIPNLGEGADSGTVVSVFVKEGDTVAKDQTLVELENEKAVAPIPSTHAGVVSKIHVKPGDKVSVGQVIVSLAESGAPAAPPSAPASAPAAPDSYSQDMPRVVETHAAPPAASSAGYQYASKSGAPPPASPSVRKMASDLGIDLTRVRGSESGGRVTLGDLKAYVQYLQKIAFSGAGTAAAPASSAAPPPAKAPESIDFSKWGSVQKKPLSSLRQKIGQKMSESWNSIPHVTQFEDVDITSLMELRKKYAPTYEKKGTKLTLTSFILKAVVAALKKFPQMNASLDEAKNELVLKQYYHLGVAVDTEAGLIVPVLKDADKKNMLEISKELEALAEKTRSRKIAADDLKGGTFTVSNLGGIGGTYFTPIINKPEAAILGVSKGVLKPVVVKTKSRETVEARLIMPVGLSYDHRIVDGADGARFIRALAEALENFSETEVKI